MTQFTLMRLAIPTLIFAALFQTGCASASKVKEKIGRDLQELLEYQDCPTVCDGLRRYLQTQLGIPVEDYSVPMPSVETSGNVQDRYEFPRDN